jgi:hypothetical protein
MADTHELILDEQNQRRMYPTSAQVAQSLAWVQRRLFHSGDGTQQEKMSTPPQLSQRTLQAKTSTVKPTGKAWQRRFTRPPTACFPSGFLTSSRIETSPQ